MRAQDDASKKDPRRTSRRGFLRSTAAATGAVAASDPRGVVAAVVVHHNERETAQRLPRQVFERGADPVGAVVARDDHREVGARGFWHAHIVSPRCPVSSR